MIKNIIANFIGKFWSILSNFLFIPIYINILGFESYSIISFTLVIAGVMAVLDAGLTATLSREFARTDNTRIDKIRVFKTLESSYFLIIAITILIVFSLSGEIAEKWLNLNLHDPESVSWFLKIISFDVGFQLLLRFYLGGLYGLEKQVKANSFQIGWGVLRNGMVVLPIIFMPSLNVFFIWQSVSTFIFVIILKIVLEKSLIGHSTFDFSMKIEKVVFKRIWHFAGGMLLISLVASINTQMDKLAISKLLSIETLGYYTLAASLAQGILVLVNPVSTATLPRFTALYSAGKNLEAAELYHKISLWVSIIVFSFMANMTFFSKELIWIWTGKMELAVNASPYLPIMAMSISMLALAIIPYNIAIANGYTKLNNLMGIISLIVTIPGYWIATRHFEGIGAAGVFCFVQTLTTLIYLYFINAKFLKIKKITYICFKEILLPLLLAIMVAFVFTYIPSSVEVSRIYSLLWIGLSSTITLILLIVILKPQMDWKSVFHSKNVNN